MKAHDQTLTKIAAVAPKREPERRDATPIEVALSFDDNRLASVVFGHYDQNIARIERRLGVTANANGNQILIRGPKEASEQARRVFEMLYQRAKLGQPAGEGDVEGVIEETAFQGTLFPGELDPGREAFSHIKTRRRGVVRARNAAQDRYLAALRNHELVFAEGPAGTGKTWLAVGHAVSLLEQGLVERLVLSRPAVEAGERLGFLPGDMKDKVDPICARSTTRSTISWRAASSSADLQTGMIEIAPLAFMRGRTLSKAAVLLDEAQNATAMQMKMFLTRLGEGSRMMVNGDPTQTDLAPGQISGLGEAIDLLSGLERVGHVRFRHGDVVRHELVRQIVEAYESAKANVRCGRAVRLGAMSVRVDFVETSRALAQALSRRARWRGRRSRRRRSNAGSRCAGRRGLRSPRRRRGYPGAERAMARRGRAHQRPLLSCGRAGASRTRPDCSGTC